jgi:hypothetical protein
MERFKHVRNIAIILVIAALIDIVPGGGDFANTVQQALYLGFLAVIAWAATRLYREHRVRLYGLGERNRAVVYVALGVIVVTLTAKSRMWQTSAGELAWLALLAGSVIALVKVVRAARIY